MIYFYRRKVKSYLFFIYFSGQVDRETAAIYLSPNVLPPLQDHNKSTHRYGTIYVLGTFGGFFLFFINVLT